MFNRKAVILFFICIFYLGHIEPGIVRVDTLKTVDDKNITLLGDEHGLNVTAEEQVSEILKFLHQCEKNNKSTHVLIEQPSSWISSLLGCQDDLLVSLPKKIEQAQPKLTLTTCENIEVRRISAAARDVVECPYSVNNKCVIDGTKKMLGTFTFQDVLDEFAHTKQMLSDYYSLSQNDAVAAIYTNFVTQADTHYKELMRIIKNKNIALDTCILGYAKNIGLLERAPLASAVLDTFSPIFDLNAIRVVLTSSHKNMIVVAGAYHTGSIYSSLYKLDAFPLYSFEFENGRSEELAVDRIWQSLEIQERSRMRMYAPAMIGKAVVFTFCYLFFSAIVQTMVGNGM